MSAASVPAASEPLLRELVGGLSAAGQTGGVSIGLVHAQAHAAQPPAHCVRTCLGGNADAADQLGCPFLQVAAKEGRVDPSLLSAGQCRQGFRVAAQPTALHGDTGVLLTVAGRPPQLEVRPQENPLAQLDEIARLVQSVDQLLSENAGFANEVLQNYEQLNLIFDLTQQVAQVTDVAAIEKLLLQRVARLVGAPVVGLFAAGGERRTYTGEPRQATVVAELPVAPADAETLVAATQRERRVQVGRLGRYHVIAGPLVRLDNEVDVVLAFREADAPAFTSGDMMLIESVLTFGGQILSNTELHERMRRLSLEVTRAMVAAIDKKDHYTSGHSERGGFLTRLTAAEMGLSPAEQQTMEWAGLLHDIGKIGIPEEILCKPGRLTPEEFKVIQQHPRMGYEILQPIGSFQQVLDGVLYHHEYPDGSGYPEGLRGDDIPLVARIIHVVDTFDALTSTRAYRQAFSLQRAFEIIEADKGPRIDPPVAEAFRRAFERYRRDEPADYALRFGNIRERE